MLKEPDVASSPLDGKAERKLYLDAAVYRLTAVKKAAYKFGDRCYITVNQECDGRIGVSFRVKDATSDLSSILGEFTNEALDQDLRERIAEETEGLRNLIIAHAFSKTSLIDAEFDTIPYESDPLRILDPED